MRDKDLNKTNRNNPAPIADITAGICKLLINNNVAQSKQVAPSKA
jgi:hypothetical protein